MSGTENTHLISFIVPVLNGQKYIKTCLDSIMKEKAPTDEVILVDNGSTDDTLKIASGYPGVQILQYPKVTISALRNRGTEHAQGDLFAFIDCDCVICPGWRAAVESVMADERIHATGSIYDIPEKSTWVERAWLSERFIPNQKINYINSGNLIIRRAVYEEVGGFNEALKTDEDSDIGARINAKGYTIYHDSAVRVIHLGNAKTLAEHFRRKLWHSTSILDTAFKNGIDKPFVMTIVFMIAALIALVLFFLSFRRTIDIVYAIFFLLLVSILSALYRILRFHNFRYFFQLIILFFVFYLARSVVITCHIVSFFKNLFQRVKYLASNPKH
ncbi:MAG: glycosyltransferase [candidate division Zixibacteria bacterium]|nr:glycosyltransferase [candidate division Zixibacteria bacterium]